MLGSISLGSLNSPFFSKVVPATVDTVGGQPSAITASSEPAKSSEQSPGICPTGPQQEKLGSASNLLTAVVKSDNLVVRTNTPQGAGSVENAGPSKASVPTSNTGHQTNRTIQGDVKGVRDKNYQIYQNALDKLAVKFPGASDRINAEKRNVETLKKDFLPTIDLDKGAKKGLKGVMNDKKDICGTSSMMKALVKKLKLPLDEKEQKKMMESSRKEFVDNGPVKTKSFSMEISVRGKTVKMTSTITPANKSVAGKVQSEAMNKRGETFISSQSNRGTIDGAANNQMTDSAVVRGDGTSKTIFSGVRHAITTTDAKSVKPANVKLQDGSGKSVADFSTELKKMTTDERKAALSPFISDKKALKNLVNGFESKGFAGLTNKAFTMLGYQPAEKSLAVVISNRNKAIDIVRSALVQQINQTGVPADGEIKLNLTSVSLVTPDGIRSENSYNKLAHGADEKAMMLDQKEAFASVQNLTDSEKTALLTDISVGGKSLSESGVTLVVKTATFNTGVNEGEAMGRSNQAGQNGEAMVVLMDQAGGKEAELKTNVSNATPELKANAKFKLEAFKALKEAVGDEFKEFGNVKGPQGNPYKMPVFLAALSQESGGALAFNCMSGKDRTGMMDVLSKRFMAELDTAMQSENIEDVKDALKFFEKTGNTEIQKSSMTVLENSGNREVQEENTTGTGFKLEGQKIKGLGITFFSSHNTEAMMANSFGVDPKNTSQITGFSSSFGA